MTDALAFLYSQSSDGILIANAAGQIEQVNPAAAAMLDTSAENLIGGAAQDCFGKNPALASLFAQPDEITIDVPLPRRRTASGTAATLDDGRRIVLLHDVTEQRDLDARREAFVMTMAHDLRNPIAALIGYAELINTVGELNPEQELFLSRVRDTARRLHDLAAELVDLAWVEAGMPLRRDPVALGRLIEGVIVELTPMAQAKGVTFSVAVQQPLAQVMGDAERIRTLLFELIHNSIHYSGADQPVTVRAWGEGDHVACSVADRGIGISEHELPLVFDRLYRARDARVQALPGGGVGLTMARCVVTRHGGDIQAVSELDRGSTFTFRLPAIRS
ncbi:MAG: PAS domain-containing sensor histidine kinase [Anaerolineae bacterium]